MVITLVGSPDDDHDKEINRGILEIEELLRRNAEGPGVQEVGRGILTIVDSGFRRDVGHIAHTGFVMPPIKAHIQEESPGVYYFR